MREIDSEERRRQKNANQRKWYAQLPQEKKDDLLQKKRTRYAALKRPTPTDQQNTEAGENNQQACSNEISDKNEANTMTNIYENELAVSAGLNIYSKQMTNTYGNPNKGITIKDTATEDLPLLRRQRELENYTSGKGKAKISLYSSFDTAGLQSTCASEMIPSTKQTTHFTQAVTYCEPDDNMEVETRPTHIQEHIGVTTPSNSGQRSKLHEGWHHGIERVNKDEYKLCGGQSLVAPRQMKSANELLTKEARVLSSAKKNPRGVSCREYYCYKLQIRPNDNSVLLRAGRLLQQYVVDMYVKLETSRLDYFRYNQEAIRAEVYQGIVDSIASGETNASKVGKRIVLPTSFTGGPRDMRKRGVSVISFPAQNTCIYTAAADGNICKLEPMTGNLLGKFKASAKAISTICFSRCVVLSRPFLVSRSNFFVAT